MLSPSLFLLLGSRARRICQPVRLGVTAGMGADMCQSLLATAHCTGDDRATSSVARARMPCGFRPNSVDSAAATSRLAGLTSSTSTPAFGYGQCFELPGAAPRSDMRPLPRQALPVPAAAACVADAVINHHVAAGKLAEGAQSGRAELEANRSGGQRAVGDVDRHGAQAVADDLVQDHDPWGEALASPCR